MATSSPGNGRKNNKAARNSSQGEDSFPKAVEHGCFVNGSGVEIEDMEYDGNRGKKRGMSESESDEGGENEIGTGQKKSPEKFIVVLRFNEKEQGNMKKINPFLLTKVLAEKIGDIMYAKILSDGNLMIRCKDEVQAGQAIQVKEIGKLKVVSSGRVGARNGGGSKGVISGVPVIVKMKDLRENLKGGKLVNAQRLQTTKEGVKKDSESVLLEFEGENMPTKVFLGYMSYPVRVYVTKPMRCFKCQRFGHTAKNCKEERRCARCGGDHEYGECGIGVKPKCCSCGGAHSVAYGGCEVMRRETNVQKVRAERGISYAEAVRVTSNASSEQGTRVAQVQGSQQNLNDGKYVDKKALVIFIAGVINSTAGITSKNEKVNIIVTAARNHLGLHGLTWDEVMQDLNKQSSQKPSCNG